MWSVVSIGHKDPAWLNQALQPFIDRLKGPYALHFIHCSASKSAQKKADENLIIQQALPKQAYKIALDASGKQHDSTQFAHAIQRLQQQHAHLAFVIGGADGLNHTTLACCDAVWSLSALTFPHKLVQLILAEQLYRTFCILHHHPYHK